LLLSIQIQLQMNSKSWFEKVLSRRTNIQTQCIKISNLIIDDNELRKKLIGDKDVCFEKFFHEPRCH
jgi:hypothetical protein